MRFRRARVLANCLSLLALTVSFGAHAAEKRLDRTFDVTPGGTLTVEAGGSDLIVTGSDSNKVVVEILVKGSQSFIDHMELTAEATSAGIAVTARQKGWLGWVSLGPTESSVKVQVPTHYNVELRTSGGDIRIAKLAGTAYGKTSGGDVEASDVRGPVSLHTSGGDVTARNVQGKVDLRTSGGDIRGERLDGEIRASTSGGDIEAELLGANRGIHATTSGGGIVLHLPADIGGVLDASTSGGSIKTELPVTTKEASERKLRGTINGGGAEILARTSGGNIRLKARP